MWIVLWLLGIGGIIATASIRVVPNMERHMLADAQKAIGPLVTSPVMITVSGHQTTISGETASESEREALIGAIQGIPGVRTVVDRLSLQAPPITELAETPAPRTEPSSDTSAITSTDAIPTASTPDTDASANAAIAETAEQPVEKATPAASLSIHMVDDALTMLGALDPTVDQSVVVNRALSALEPGYLTNRIETVATTTEATWLDAVTGFLPTLAALANPSIEVSGRQVTLAGTAGTREEHDQIIASALKTLSDFALVERIDVAPPVVDIPADAPAFRADEADATELDVTSDIDWVAALERDLGALDDRRLQFLPNSAEFVEGSAERLNRIASTFKRYPGTLIEIEGHTDTSGDADANMLLSQRRATTVREALIDRGIDGERLVAYGYGEGVPLVDNATAEGRARNRRIEFRIKALEEQP